MVRLNEKDGVAIQVRDRANVMFIRDHSGELGLCIKDSMGQSTYCMTIPAESFGVLLSPSQFYAREWQVIKKELNSLS